MHNPDIEKNDHRWGFKDTSFEMKNGQTFFKNNRYPFMRNAFLPNFTPFIKEVLGVEDLDQYRNDEIQDKKISPPFLNQKFFKEIQKKFKSKYYSLDDHVRLTHSHGQMTTDEIFHLLYVGSLERYVDLVFFPHREKEIEDLIILAKKYKVCLVPYGGGSNVSGALLLSKRERRMIVSVDMRFMNKILSIDSENLTATIEAGIVGRHLEEKLEEKGYTMGHEPDSMEFSTLGGWIATHASGMKRNKYGNIEDIVKSYRLLTPEGNISNKNDFDRSSVGMDPKKIFFGNEGNLGIITQATVKIHPYPKMKKFYSILFPNFELGVQFLRELSTKNYIASSVRLVDNVQFRFGYALKENNSNFTASLIDAFKKFFITKIKKFDPYSMCLLVLAFEGEESEITDQMRKHIALGKKFKGIPAGASNGRRGYTLTNMIAYIRDFLSDYYVIGETFETTVPWSKIDEVCQAAKKELFRCHKANGIPGNPYISWRITQLYHSDVCIYFTMGMYFRGIPKASQIYSKIEKQIRKVIISHGGSISHHHGIGKMRKEFLQEIFNQTELNLLRNLKQSLDPQNIFSIGNNVFFSK